MKKILLLIGLLFVTSCSTKLIQNNTNDYQEEICDQKTSLNIRTADCPEGCFKQYTLIYSLNKTEYPKNYSLPYELKVEQDNCGLHQLVYYKQTGKFITHIYDNENNLLGAYESEEECQNLNVIYNNITIDCHEINDKVIFKIIQTPDRYLEIKDCK